METDLAAVSKQTELAVSELLQRAALTKGDILVVGCSTSEVRGASIGSAGSEAVAEDILSSLMVVCANNGVNLAIQCCEHLNRALVVEKRVMLAYNLEQVSVIPVANAGGALAACAIRMFEQPVLVEFIQAKAGLDIGNTLIGMHIKHVAVPVRLEQKFIGQAIVTAAHTRPKMIGGARAVYE